MGASATTSTAAQAGYVLRDELAQLSLPALSHDPGRKVAWVNAICCLVLFVGYVGVEKPMRFVQKLRTEEPLILPLENVQQPPAPPELAETSLNTVEDQVVEPIPLRPTIVVANAADVPFPVVVQNATLITAQPVLAPPPPRTPTIAGPPTASAPQTGPIQAPRAKSVRPGWGELTGEFPPFGDEDYPIDAKKRGEEGVVRVNWNVNPDGSISGIRVGKSSGSTSLDHAAINFIRKKYKFNPTGKNHSIFWDFEFRLGP